MNITHAVASNCQRVREEKKLTLDHAAAVTGVSRSMLAQIEKGDVNPTISVLWKIANGYKVSFTTLVEPENLPTQVLRAGSMEPIVEDGGGYVNYPAFPFDERLSFETYRIAIRLGGHLEAQPHMAGTEELITVFSGRVEIGVGEETFLLETGDSIRFRADVPHSYRNCGTESVQLSMIIYYGAS